MRFQSYGHSENIIPTWLNLEPPGLPASLHPFLDSLLDPGDHQVTNFPAPCLLGAGVDGAADTGYSLEAFHLVMLVVAEQSQKAMVRRQLSKRGGCCKPRNPKMGYHLGSQDLACHLSGLPSLHPANLTSETQFICYGEENQKLMLPPVHFLPPQSSHFCQTLSVKRDHLDLFFGLSFWI